MKHIPLESINEHRRPEGKIPSMAEYAMAKKEMEIGVDMAEGKDETGISIVDRQLLLLLYWYTIPVKYKKRIKIGEKHDDVYLKSLANKT